MVAKKNGFLRKWLAQPEFGVVFLVIILSGFFSVQTEGVWISSANMSSVLQVTAILGILAIGEALVITSGEIDISVGSVLGIGALIYLGISPYVSEMLAVLITLAAGAAIGFFNGYLVTRMKISSLIATLGTLFIFRGFCYSLTEGFSFYSNEETKNTITYAIFGGSSFYEFNVAIIWVLASAFLLHLLMFKTFFGNRLLAIGGDEETAHSRGVMVSGIKIAAFVLCAVLAALAGILEASKIGFADGSFGRLQELEAIASCVIGGCLLRGGRCSIIGTLLGAFLLSGIQSFLVLNGIQPQWFMILLGLLVVGALLSDRTLRKWVPG